MAVAVSFIPRFVAFKDWEQVSAYDAPATATSARIGQSWMAWVLWFALMGKNLGAVLDCPVYSLDWLGDGVTAKTAKGDIQAKCAVITVSTAIIAEQLLRFNPPLPDEFLSAAQSLPMGNYNTYTPLCPSVVNHLMPSNVSPVKNCI